MKKSFRLDKMIRDKLYHKMISSGASVYLKENLTEKDKQEHLKQKLCEEAHEVLSCAQTNEMIEECADVLQVLHDLAFMYNISLQDIESARREKHIQRGGFSQCYVVDYVTLDADHPLVSYYQKQSHKYPVITNKQ
jgi:predicted house-cleaning noncanonical NTP pyrophosphatase (MazG superfamily)